jgi:hypothetical protein
LRCEVRTVEHLNRCFETLVERHLRDDERLRVLWVERKGGGGGVWSVASSG